MGWEISVSSWSSFLELSQGPREVWGELSLGGTECPHPSNSLMLSTNSVSSWFQNKERPSVPSSSSPGLCRPIQSKAPARVMAFLLLILSLTQSPVTTLPPTTCFLSLILLTSRCHIQQSVISLLLFNSCCYGKTGFPSCLTSCSFSISLHTSSCLSKCSHSSGGSGLSLLFFYVHFFKYVKAIAIKLFRKCNNLFT